MTQAALKDTLRSMVLKYGFDQVDESLREIRISGYHPGRANRKTRAPNRSAARKSGKRSPRPTAPQYVAKMELPSEKEPAVVELARRFQDKSFLPTFGDIANFCRTYGIDEPASKSRASAIPRVFKFVASMAADDIQGILDEGMFSGPSRLGPIADAIRRNGRAATAANAKSIAQPEAG